MERLLAARPDIDAVFAASDLMAAGAMAVLAPPAGGSPRTSRSSASTTRPSPRPSPAPHQRATADRGDGPRDGPAPCRGGRRHGHRPAASDPRHRARTTRLERREARALSRPATGGSIADGGARSVPDPGRHAIGVNGNHRGGDQSDARDTIRTEEALRRSAPSRPSWSRPCGSAASPSPSRVGPGREPGGGGLADAAPVAVDGAHHPGARRRRPGPNGGTVVRWFIGLGAGAQPAADRAGAGVRHRLQQLPEGRLHRARDLDNNARRRSSRPRSRPATRRTSSVRSGVEGLNTFADQLLDLKPLIAKTNYTGQQASTRSSSTSSTRSARTAPRSACRSPSTRR